MSIATTAAVPAMTAEVSTRAAAPKFVWAFQLIAAAILGMTVPFKFMGAPETVALFDEVGAGAAGRIGTAVLESIAILMLLTPRLAVLGGGLTLGLLSGAILSHLTILGIVYPEDASLFTMAVIGWVSAAVIVLLRRRELPILGEKL